MRFRFHFCSDASVQVQGFAIDNFCVVLPSPQDAGVTQILQPGSQGPAGACQPVIVTIKNFGTQTITATDVFYNFNGTVFGPFNWTGNLAPGLTTTDTLPCVTIPVGAYTICSWTDLLNDGNHFNDTICSGGFGFPVDTLSICDDFESGSPGWFSSPAVGSSAWQLGTPAYGATTGAHSGVNAWDINLNSPYTTGALDTLYTPIFNLTGAINPYMTFWQNTNTSDQNGVDGFWIEYTTNSGLNWQTLGSVGTLDGLNWYNAPSIAFGINSGWAGNSNGWVKSTYFLSNSIIGNNGYVQFRFVFQSYQFGVPLDGVSIDDFCMTIPPPIDAGVIALTNTNGICTPEGATDGVSVTVHNFGTTTINSTNVYYSVNGGSPIGPYVYSGAPIPPAGNATFTLTGFPYTIPAYGNYTINAWTDLTGDGDHGNDSSAINLYSIKVNVPSYCDDFEMVTRAGWPVQQITVLCGNWELRLMALPQEHTPV